MLRTSRRLGFFGEVDPWDGPAFFLVFQLELPAEITTITEPIIDRFGCQLVLGTFRREQIGWVLRLLIEKKDATPESGSGVDIALCAAVSRDISAALDVEDAIDRKYTLEVSSAGLERPLVGQRDFERFKGYPIAVTTTQAVEGARRFKGKLNGSQGDTITMTLADGRTVSIPGQFIKKANLTYEPRGFGAKTGD